MLILPEWLVTSHDAAPRRDWGLRVVGSRVAEVGPAAQLIAAHPDDERVDAPRRVALPGFVNTHVHLYGVLAHGIATATAPDGFWSFLESYWWPQVEDAIDAARPPSAFLAGRD